MLRGLFITGTDTGVGKTAVAAALVCRYRNTKQICYWKPIQTGIAQDDDTATVRRLASCADDECFDQGIRLPQPLSPHLAATLSGTAISISNVAGLVEKRSGKSWIVEGAGGALVPLNDTETMADLIVRLALPAVVVSRTTLGTINHTLMTLEVLRRRDVHVAGVVFVGEPNARNREAIERFGNVAIIGEMPRFESLTPDAIKQWSVTELDASGMLSAHF